MFQQLKLDNIDFAAGVGNNASMKRFTAIVHRGEPGEGGFWATCLEVPGANGQGETKDDCLQNLREAIGLMLESEREEAFRLDPQAETAELILS
jgi:predicted RNase H-like HicB family nuclease